MKVHYAIVFVSDMAQSISFYRDLVGLPLKFESTKWTEFATQGATLALHKTDDTNSLDNAHLEPAGRCRPGIQVPSVEEFHERMLAHDVPCIQAPTWVFGARLAQYSDPDGLIFSVGEESSST